jgi:hypothetical protein
MLTIKKIFFTLSTAILSGLFLPVCGQENELLEVLKKNEPSKEFFFDHSTKKDGSDKVCVKYLGAVKNSMNGAFKVVTWSRVWGKNRHTSGSIYIYDKQNKYLGKYILGSKQDLPIKISECYLVFSNKSKVDCDEIIETKINFCNNLPKELFIKCKGESGDIYSLSK